MQHSERFVVPSKEHMMCNLNRKLVWTERRWYKKFDSFMCKSGFYRRENNQCCFFE